MSGKGEQGRERASDKAVQSTNNDAYEAKCSAVSLGYYKDPFLPYFAPNQRGRVTESKPMTGTTPGSPLPGQTSRPKPPIINRGYYARTRAVREVVDAFMTASGDGTEEEFVQIINLGAGSDTLFWNIMAQQDQEASVAGGEEAHKRRKTAQRDNDEGREEGPEKLSGGESQFGKKYKTLRCFVEMDFEEVVMRKCSAIRRHAVLQKPLRDKSKELDDEDGEVGYLNTGTAVHSRRYHLLAGDLRGGEYQRVMGERNSEGEKSGDGSGAGVRRAGRLAQGVLDWDIPTLVLSECVLVYLPTNDSFGILEWVCQNFTRAAFFLYEPINPHNNPFMRVMQQNLVDRACPLLSMVSTCQAQMDRFIEAGFTRGLVGSTTMLDLWNRWMARANNAGLVTTAAEPTEDSDPRYSGDVQGEMKRVCKIQVMDEFEEWELMMGHYCVAVAIHSGQLQGQETAPSDDEWYHTLLRNVIKTQLL
eukprot:Nk52_evm21s216 gene=Nk52_evmTU21s216